MDPTGGGPELATPPPEEFGRKAVPFRRYVVPEPVTIPDLPKLPDAPLGTFFLEDNVTVRRPLLGYPSVVFTGKYADPIPLLQAASDAAIGVGAWGIPDPDVQHVRIDVEIRTLQLDNLHSRSGKEPYIKLYTTQRDFPAEAHSFMSSESFAAMDSSTANPGAWMPSSLVRRIRIGATLCGCAAMDNHLRRSRNNPQFIWKLAGLVLLRRPALTISALGILAYPR